MRPEGRRHGGPFRLRFAPLFSRALFKVAPPGSSLQTHSAPHSSQRSGALVGLAPTGSAPLSPPLRGRFFEHDSRLILRHAGRTVARALPPSLARSTGRPRLGEGGADLVADCRRYSSLATTTPGAPSGARLKAASHHFPSRATRHEDRRAQSRGLS